MIGPSREPKKSFFIRYLWSRLPGTNGAEWMRARLKHECTQLPCVRHNHDIAAGEYYLLLDTEEVERWIDGRKIYGTRPVCSDCAALMIYRLPVPMRNGKAVW